MNFSRRLILASKSPRRQQLLRAIVPGLEIRTKHVEEDYPDSLKTDQVAAYLAQKKALAFRGELKDEVLITSDTTVVLGDQILGKPEDEAAAFDMLSALSGGFHHVDTGVCILSREKQVVFNEVTRVYFGKLTDETIRAYISSFHPLDKAGAYGIQDCIEQDTNLLSQEDQKFLLKINKPLLYEETMTSGSTKPPAFYIDHIEGSYFNVMGLPVARLYHELSRF